eukprot:362744-Chlamydomonas_euryale.AAC.5
MLIDVSVRDSGIGSTRPVVGSSQGPASTLSACNSWSGRPFSDSLCKHGSCRHRAGGLGREAHAAAGGGNVGEKREGGEGKGRGERGGNAAQATLHPQHTHPHA